VKSDTIVEFSVHKSYARFTQKAYSPDLQYDQIIQFVERNKDKPFFLNWTATLPHVALQAPGRWVKHYVEKFGDEEPYLAQRGYYPSRYPHATYAAMISYLDEQIGGLVATLKKLGIYDNTVIIFTSDNGPVTGAGGADALWFDGAYPFRSDADRIKGSLLEGGIRVPMVIAWKDRISRPGTSSDHICASWDIMATVCELAGTQAPPSDGISFVPTLVGGKQKQHAYMYWEFPEKGGSKAIRMGKWKGLILNIRNNGETGMKLFDLDADPAEQNDVAAKHPDIVKTMREHMAAAHVDPVIERFRIFAK
jgi:arylsulfatase